jgi:hypothetical protein
MKSTVIFKIGNERVRGMRESGFTLCRGAKLIIIHYYRSEEGGGKHKHSILEFRGGRNSLINSQLPVDYPWIRPNIQLFFYRDRLEALAGLIRPPRRKPKCDRTATGRDWRHWAWLAQLDMWMPTGHVNANWTLASLKIPLTGVTYDWSKARCQ